MSQSSSPPPGPPASIRLVYSFLSSLIPGAGQIVAGNWRRGAIMLGVTLILGVAGIVVYLQGTSTILSWMVQPRMLVGVFVLNLIVLLFRIGAVIDAYLSPRSVSGRKPQGWRGAVAVLALALVLTVTAAPHAVLGYYTYLTHDMLTTVFSVEELTEVTSVPTPTPEPAPMLDPTPEQ